MSKLDTYKSANPLIQLLDDDVFRAISFLAVFVRVFQHSSSLFINRGISYVEYNQFENLFRETYPKQNLIKNPSLFVLINAINACPTKHKFMLEGGFLSYHGSRSHPCFPRILELLTDIFSGQLNPSRLEYAIWEEAAAFYNISFVPFIQHIFCILSETANKKLFAEQGTHRYTWEEVTSILIDSIKSVNYPSSQKIVLFFLEILLNLDFIFLRGGPLIDRPLPISREVRYIFRSRILPEYLLVRSLGFSTGIPGLDYLLGGGVLFPIEGASAIVTGPPGTGKSSISHLLALQVALLGGVSVYVSLDMDADLSLRMLVQFRPTDILQVSYGNTMDDLTKSSISGSGIILFPPTINITSFRAFSKSLSNYLDKIPSKLGNRRLLIIDPLNLVYLKVKDSLSYKISLRELMLKCILLAKKYSFTTLFSVEHDSMYEPDEHEQFAVDLVLRTERDKDQNTINISILKSRYQPSWQGKNALVFEPSNGPEIFPEAPYISYSLRYRRLSIKHQKQPYWFNTLNGWEKFLGKSNWWWSPSVTALVGTQGSLKRIFLDTMLTAKRRENRGKAIVHLILGQESLPLRPQDPKSVDFNRYLFRYGTQLDNLHRIENDAEVFLVFSVRHVQTEQILWCFLEVLKKLRSQGIDIAVCAFDDLTTLENDFPNVIMEDGFLSTFIDICRDHNADAIISCSLYENNQSHFTLHQIEHIADNIIELRNARFGGGSVHTLHIRKCLSENYPDDFYEIQVTKEGSCCITSKLQLVNAVTSDTLQFVKTEITLYAETPLQQKYVERVKSTYEIQYDEVVNVSIIYPNSLDWSLSTTTHLLPKRRLRVIQTDSYQIDLEAKVAKQQNDLMYLIDLSQYKPIKDLLEEFRTDSIPFSCRSCNSSKNCQNSQKFSPCIPSVPYYLNPSILVLLKDELFSEYKADSYETGWEWLLEQAIKFRNRLTDNQRVFLFACPLGTDENINTLFLEILIYYIKKSNPTIDLLFKGGSCKGLNLLSFLKQYQNQVFQATLMVCQLLVECTPFENLLSHQGKDENKKISKKLQYKYPMNAIFYRSWFDTAQQFMQDLSQLQNPFIKDYTFSMLPGKISSRGDWHLAIPYGSAVPDEGIKFIYDLCGEEAAWQRLEYGVGLPPHRVFYENPQLSSYLFPATGLTFNEINELLKNGIERSVFDNYRKMGPKLAFYINHFIKQYKRLQIEPKKCFRLNSKDNPKEIAQFIEHMEKIWPGYWNKEDL